MPGILLLARHIDRITDCNMNHLQINVGRKHESFSREWTHVQSQCFQLIN